MGARGGCRPRCDGDDRGTTVAVIAAGEILDHPGLVGAAAAATIVGAAIGTSVLAAIMERRGRRSGLVVGYGGALIAAWGVVETSIIALALGTTLIGLANSSIQLSR